MALAAGAQPKSNNATAWRIALNVAPIVLMTLLTLSVIAGFILIRDYNHQLGDLRESARQTRYARQMLMEVQENILDGLARPDGRFDVAGYAGALNRLEEQANAKFPASIIVDGKTFPTSEVLDRLRSTWSRLAQSMENGQLEAARTAYASERPHTILSAVTTAIHSDLQTREAAYETVQRRMVTATDTVLILQLLTGLVCILAFLFATMSRARVSAARSRVAASAEAQREQVTKLFEMTDMLQSANDHADANAVLRSTAFELLPDFGGALYVFNNSRDRLVLSTSWGIASGDELAETIGLQQCWALKRGKRHINRPRSKQLCCDHEIGDHDTLEIPMIARGEILGLLQIHALRGSTGESLEQIGELATAIADAMSLALANIALRDKLRSQALRDPLTGLYNRRYMEDALQRAARLAEREQHKLSVIMIDLDHFKRLNDQFGHTKGDSVLRDTAAVLMNRLRETDIACRYGGEELLIVMPNCDLDAAALKAEQLRHGIEALSEPNGAQVSASFGVATLPEGATSMIDFLATADAALYQAKQDGRNRVVLAGRVVTDPPAMSEDNMRPLPVPLKRKSRAAKPR